MTSADVKTIADLVRLSAEEFGEKVFVKEKNGKEIDEKSFSEFYNDAKRINGFLHNKGKIHASVIGATSYNYLISWFGTAIGGNVVVPIDAQLSCEDICDLVRRADVSVFFYDARFKPMIPQIKAECPDVDTYICFGDSDDDISIYDILEQNSPKEPTEIDSDDLASIVYTSGTTGKSKGVMLSHGNLIDNAFCCDNESDSSESLLSVLPIHHVYCFTCDIMLSIRYGVTLCINDSMMRIVQNLKLFQPSFILLVPMIASTIYRQIKTVASTKPDVPIQDIASAVFGGKLKGIYSGGAYLDPKLIEAYAELGIPMAQGYGMTECSPRISSSIFTDKSFGDVGTVVKGCEIKIVDGEITVKSPSVMKGYYKDPEETAKVLSDDGWLSTGDLGYVENNRIFITGRKKNLIILSNGENISPEELENKFVGVDLVAEVMVYDDEEVITAEIYPNPEMSASMEKEQIISSLKAIIDDINKTVSSSKSIRRIRLRDSEFDKTTSKKIRRNQTTHGEII